MTFGRENKYSLGKLLCLSELCCITKVLFSKGFIIVRMVFAKCFEILEDEE